MPSAVWYGDRTLGEYAIKDSLKYAYDEIGNISKIYSNGEMSVRYAYDKLSHLVREDNKPLGKTWLYAYDNNGNIISKREFAYTLRKTELLEELSDENKVYSYDGDRLMSLGNEMFEYDGIGNPTTYLGKKLEWTKGRQLTKFADLAFTYDSQGRRLSKGGITFIYDSDGRLIKQSNGLEFIYDNSGVIGIYYGGNAYLYRKDAQGNITAILDNSGVVVVKYEYDAWGNHGVEVLNSACATLANLNPFRCRGYGNKMEISEAIYKRESIRNYKNIPISKDKIKQIIDAGIRAPSGKNGQPWKVIVVQDDKNLLTQLANLTAFRGFVRKADCLIIVLLDKSISYNHDKDMQAMGAFIENMLLTATALGLGACWVGEITNHAEEIKHILSLQDEYEIIAFISIGEPDAEEKPIKEKTYKEAIEKWL